MMGQGRVSLTMRAHISTTLAIGMTVIDRLAGKSRRPTAVGPGIESIVDSSLVEGRFIRGCSLKAHGQEYGKMKR
jgi:hypothetical protein